MTAPPVAELRVDILKLVPTNFGSTVVVIIVLIAVLVWIFVSRH
jgi:hypothetical protein